MGQVIHGSATRRRRSVEGYSKSREPESSRKAYGTNQTTIAKWKRR